MPEPIAAASYFDAVVRDRDRPPGNLVVYDLGAGTFDVSVVARADGGFEVRVTDGLADIGGLDIDAAIVGFLGARSPRTRSRSGPGWSSPPPRRTAGPAGNSGTTCAPPRRCCPGRRTR